MFRLGTMLSDNYAENMLEAITHSVVLFTVLWLSWMHFNMLESRFNLVFPWNVFECVPS